MKTLREKIAVMQAAANGKAIVVRALSDGLELGVQYDPAWNWERFDYGLAPEAVRYRVYIREASNGVGCPRVRQAHICNECGMLPETIEKLPGFVGWVHDKWQTP